HVDLPFFPTRRSSDLILSFLIYWVSSVINRKSKIMQKSQSAISTFVQDSFSGIRVVKFFARERYIARNYGIKVRDYQDKALDLRSEEHSLNSSHVKIS